MNKKILGILLISNITYGADFSIQFSPEDNSISTVKLQDGSVTTSKIADGSIDDSKISSISSSKISDFSSAVINELPVGMIQEFAGLCPTGWLPTDGSSISRVSYSRLFSTIGTSYGSADALSFNLPDIVKSNGEFIGSITWGGNPYSANCYWTYSGGVPSRPSPVPSCISHIESGSTSIAVTEPSSKIPGIKIVKAPKGVYKVHVTGVGHNGYYQISDGSNAINTQGASLPNGSNYSLSLEGEFSYSSGGVDKTFDIITLTNNGTATLYGRGYQSSSIGEYLKISVYKYSHKTDKKCIKF